MISEVELIWRSPWEPVSGPSAARLEAELALELSPAHPLYGVRASALGKCTDSDDVLFSLVNGPALFAVVHLTWRGQAEPDVVFPETTFFKTAQEGMGGGT